MVCYSVFGVRVKVCFDWWVGGCCGRCTWWGCVGVVVWGGFSGCVYLCLRGCALLMDLLCAWGGVGVVMLFVLYCMLGCLTGWVWL